MKKVVLSGKFLNSKINGIPRYAMEVVKHMDPLAEGMDIEICYPTDLAADKIPDLKNIKPVPFGKNGKGWDILCGEKYARRKNALYVNLASRGGLYKNSIVCLHDIRPLTWDLQHGKKTNQFLLDKLNFWLVAHNSKKIVTISEFCRQEIAEYYHLNASDIAVAPEGAEHLNAIVCSEKMLEKGEFYFSIGSMAPHKSFEWVVRTAKNNPQCKFLIAGGIDPKIWNYKADFSETQNVTFLGYISDEEMKWYMQHAKALLFPSFYEGFGIPPLEALALGTPVIASDIPVLREVFGDTIHYANPMDYHVNLDKLLQESVEPADRVLEKETWENAAKFWLEVIKQNA